ncbi:MAG TPA: AAA family ATPase [Kofleriaceae bacterium]
MTDLQTFNVITGRNNSGKTTLLEAIRIQSLWASGTTSTPPRIEVEMEFSDEERRAILNRALKDDVVRVMTSPAFSKVRMTFDAVTRGNDHVGTLTEMETINLQGSMERVLHAPTGERSLQGEFIPLRTATAQTRGSFRVVSPESFNGTGVPSDLLIDWLAKSFARWRDNTFAFAPRRASAAAAAAKTVDGLNGDGTNLASVIYTLWNNRPEALTKITELVREVIPEVSAVRNRSRETECYVEVMCSGRPATLSQVGQGVEQVLLFATALVTKPESNFVIEEPELNLHPGAQRSLARLLSREAHQVIVSTHSHFMRREDAAARHYHLEAGADGTTCGAVSSYYTEVAKVLLDLGLDPDELALERSIILVEGKSDAETLQALARTAGQPLRARVVLLGGGESGIARSHSRVLMDLKPGLLECLVVLDRDERSGAELEVLESKPHIRVLQRRELENYVLEPTVVLDALRRRAVGNAEASQQLKAVTSESLQLSMQSIAETFRATVEVKSIFAELRWPSTRDLARELSRVDSGASTGDVVEATRTAASQSISDWEARTSEVMQRVAQRWESLGALACAPGADVLAEVYRRHGFKFDKVKDMAVLTSLFPKEHLAADLAQLLTELAAL